MSGNVAARLRRSTQGTAQYPAAGQRTGPIIRSPTATGAAISRRYCIAANIRRGLQGVKARLPSGPRASPLLFISMVGISMVGLALRRGADQRVDGFRQCFQRPQRVRLERHRPSLWISMVGEPRLMDARLLRLAGVAVPAALHGEVLVTRREKSGPVAHAGEGKPPARQPRFPILLMSILPLSANGEREKSDS